MKRYSLTALIVAIAGFVAIVTAIETPRKPTTEDNVYVLPLVEDMPRTANPLQF